MKSKTHLVAFIDILGFKNLVDNHFSGKDKTSLTFLKESLKKAEAIGINFSKGYLKQFNYKFSFRQFSDCVSISMPFKRIEANTIPVVCSFMSVVQLYQSILLNNSILVRGGISIGGHFENSNTIFSDGLVKAYNIEAHRAIYPRIVIDGEILSLLNDTFKKMPNKYSEFYDYYGHIFIMDWDDEVFITPFDLTSKFELIENRYGKEKIKEFIFEGLKNSKTKFDLPNDFMEDFILNYNETLDLKAKLEKVDEYIINNKNGKAEILLKFKWLKQFIIWNLTPQESAIKFEYFYKKDTFY